MCILTLSKLFELSPVSLFKCDLCNQSIFFPNLKTPAIIIRHKITR